jgi:hypothetical protein
VINLQSQSLFGNIINTMSYLMMGRAMTAAASATWHSANRATFIPFRIPRATIVKELFYITGSASSGNIDMGIYTSDFTRIVSSGSTAQGASAQTVYILDITDTLLERGTYYLAVAMDNTTGTMMRQNTSAAGGARLGMATMNTAFPLPATVTAVTPATGYMPMIGLTTEAAL